MLLHRFEQRGLRLGRRAVDFVGQHHVGKDRPFHESEKRACRWCGLLQDFRSGDVRRHQVGRELHALERQMQHVADRLDQQRLGQSRHADQQHVALAEHCRQHLLDHFALPDDDFAQFGGHRLVGLG